MAAHADAHWAGSVHLPVPCAEEVKSHLNKATSAGAYIDDVYWNVSASVFRGLIDQVRTTAVSILTEIRVESAEVGMSGTEAASNAIHLHVEGGSRHSINVTTNKSVHGHAGTASAGDNEAVRWTKRQTYWTVLGVVVAIAALYMAYLQLRG
ncbi:hypothetical protein GA0070621_1346 [Micromonospora narathiwatensis]|uniref:Uncharacterized protein n=2 Tax=Micromonospora narathiwatensis TaxID=299146 RepID=A0A1A8ZDG2_9ACTN|nr:hypothetical protein GA0070621_1346 [Micromonospora narathiwatensis]